MKSVYVLRHTKAERGAAGKITEEGETAAQKRAVQLPQFAIVLASSAERAMETARLLSGQDPEVADGAGFYMAEAHKSEAILKRAAENGETFLNAALGYAQDNHDMTLLEGMDRQADTLVSLVRETLSKLPNDEAALIITHDMTLIRALQRINQETPDEIPNLEGCVFHDDGTVELTFSKR
jgi:broad specificity phosphatase PhoE